MYCWPSGKYVHLLYMYSILGRGSFCFNYCLNAAWRGGDQFVALLRWFEAQVSLTVAFSSSAFFCLLFLIFLLTIPNRFSMGFRSGEFAGCWSFKQLLVLLAVWQVPNPAGKWYQYLSKAGQQKEAWSAPKCIGKRVQWRWFSKNTMDQHQQMTLHPKSSQTVETYFKQLGLWASPPFLQTLGPWFPNEIQNLLSSEKRTLDHWATVQFFFCCSAQVRRLWRQL